jgi:hypothetical protein
MTPLQLFDQPAQAREELVEAFGRGHVTCGARLRRDCAHLQSQSLRQRLFGAKTDSTRKRKVRIA